MLSPNAKSETQSENFQVVTNHSQPETEPAPVSDNSWYSYFFPVIPAAPAIVEVAEQPKPEQKQNLEKQKQQADLKRKLAELLPWPTDAKDFDKKAIEKQILNSKLVPSEVEPIKPVETSWLSFLGNSTEYTEKLKEYQEKILPEYVKQWEDYGNKQKALLEQFKYKKHPKASEGVNRILRETGKPLSFRTIVENQIPTALKTAAVDNPKAPAKKPEAQKAEVQKLEIQKAEKKQNKPKWQLQKSKKNR